MSRLPLSPPSEPGSPSNSHSAPVPNTDANPDPVPLTSALRTTPIHPLLPEILIPNDCEGLSLLSTHQYNPVTCTRLDIASIRPKLQQLRKEYPSATAALKAQEDAAREIKQRMKDAERKRAEVQKALDKKIKERDTELKVLSKYQEVKASELPS